MLKCTGHYGTPDKVPADVYAVLLAEDAAQFTAGVRAACPAVAAVAARQREAGIFSGKKGEVLPIVTAEGTYVLAGLGPKDGLDLDRLRRAAAAAARIAAGLKAGVLAVYCPPEELTRRNVSATFEEVARAIAEGAMLAAYRYERFLSKAKEKDHAQIRELKVVTTDEGYQSRMKNALALAATIVEGVELARDLANAPANALSADLLAKEAVALGRKTGIKTLVLTRKEIEANRMGGLLGVNQGSRKDPRFIVLEYNESKRRLAPFVLVGKGITFDSGGLSLKPAAAMEDMKADMSGAAAVLGTMLVAAKLKLPVRLVGLIPATDNMPGGSALCPGDIITIANGTTVEVKNTDAEGRLILADALVYAQRFKPAAVIDVATLTGAVVVALASHFSGLFATDPALLQHLRDAGDRTGERVWPMPLSEEYEDMMKGDVADLVNTGGRYGGACTAAAFLRRFAGDAPWAHVDIAGTAFLEKEGPWSAKGASGVGVRLLTEFLMHASAPEGGTAAAKRRG